MYLVWPKLQFYIFGLSFFNCTFSLSLWCGNKDKVDSFLLQSLWTAGNLTCWCILTTLWTDQTLVIICWFSSFWWHFDLVKQMSNVRFLGIFVTVYERNVPKFVMFISILWYPQKWKGQILAHDNHPVTERGVYMTAVYSDFSFFVYHRPTKPSPSTTLPRVGV